METAANKGHLLKYLDEGRSALRWKLEGLGEYDIRRPLTPTGTNLLGLVKHVASMEAEYFGEVFDRPFGEALPWLADDAEPNADLWAGPEESRESILSFYERACAHADATIAALELDSVGHVPWWGNRPVTLHLILVHMVAETHRHAGHGDIVRELVDGQVGLLPGNSNVADGDPAWWANYFERLESAARASKS
jgi:hypothetical protein